MPIARKLPPVLHNKSKVCELMWPLSINCLARNLKKEFRTQVEVLYYGGAVLYILQETFQDESYNALFASLFLFFSQSVSQQPPTIWTCLRQSKRKLLFAKHQLSIWILKEKIDKMRDGETPRVKINKEREVFATNSIKTRFDNFTLLKNWVVCVCVKCYFTLTKKCHEVLKRARLVSTTYK